MILRTTMAAIGLLVASLAFGQQTERREPVIRVQVMETSPTILLKTTGKWQMQSGSKSVVLADPTEISIRSAIGPAANDDGTQVLSLAAGEILKLSAETSGAQISLASSGKDFIVFPGNLEIRSTSVSLSAISHVPLEEYLRGVVPSEIGAGSPAEAMSAQAVAARSFAVLAVSEPKHLAEGYDVCSTVDCQAYHGMLKVTEACDQAVQDTRGIVLTYNGKPIPAYYSSMCAGHSEDLRNVWPDRSSELAYHDMARPDSGTTFPYDLSREEEFRKALVEMPAVYCNPEQFKVLSWAGKNFRWSVEFSAEDVSGFVAKRQDIGRVTAIRPMHRGPSGRISKLEIVGETGREVVGPELIIRRTFKPALRSSAFVVDTRGPEDKPTHFVFSGGGSGHGVGMCQTGAMGMANHGKDFRQILKHYYSTAELEKLY